jgi:SAM-dependent methyltransferase
VTGMKTRHIAGDGATRDTLLEYLHGCPVCGNHALRDYCEVASLFNAGETIRYERCARCGVVLRNPRLPAEHRLGSYEERVFDDAAKRLDPRQQVHYRHMLAWLRRWMPRDGSRRLLDFGCGAGGFLVAAREAGFEPRGIELCRDLAQHVERAHGIAVHGGDLDAPAFAAERFAVIVSSQVFEHLLDPRETLAQLRRHLDASGLLLIEVPNLSDIRERLRRGSTMDDSHLFYFDRRSLGRMLGDGGFRVLGVREGLRPYRLFAAADWLPPRLNEWAEGALSALQIKTGLSVLAQAV